MKAKFTRIKCLSCHKLFLPNRSDKKYCKDSCVGRAGKLKRRYNVTPAEIYAIYKKQEGKCAICEAKGDIWELGFKTKAPFCIDHDHKSGKVRGLLCSHCNKGLGMFRDNRKTMVNAIKYLKLHAEKKNET